MLLGSCLPGRTGYLEPGARRRSRQQLVPALESHEHEQQHGTVDVHYRWHGIEEWRQLEGQQVGGPNRLTSAVLKCVPGGRSARSRSGAPARA